jgi:putative membrane protein insertion efficiency factor
MNSVNELNLDETHNKKTIEKQRSPRLSNLEVNIRNLARLPFLALIRLYQLTFSKMLAPDTCRYYPSCSHYGYQAIYKYGILKGGYLATYRILRCNPFSKGGYDPIPENK